MSRSPWVLLSLAMPAALGAVTIACTSMLATPTRQQPPAPQVIESNGDSRVRQEGSSEPPVTPAEREVTPPRNAEKAVPVRKPRSNKPGEASGPVLLA